MPDVFSPQTLYRVALGKMTEDGIYAVAKITQEDSLTKTGVFGRHLRERKVHASTVEVPGPGLQWTSTSLPKLAHEVS